MNRNTARLMAVFEVWETLGEINVIIRDKHTLTQGKFVRVTGRQKINIHLKGKQRYTINLSEVDQITYNQISGARIAMEAFLKDGNVVDIMPI